MWIIKAYHSDWAVKIIVYSQLYTVKSGQITMFVMPNNAVKETLKSMIKFTWEILLNI